MLKLNDSGILVVIGIREPAIQGHRRITKRILDLAVGLLVLSITWPLLIVIWIAIRIRFAGTGSIYGQKSRRKRQDF